MDASLITIITVACGTAISTIATQIFNERRDTRKHTWSVEDRQFAASISSKLDANAAKVENKLDEHNDRIESATQKQSAEVLVELAKNTELSVKAFAEANDVNRKINDVHARIDVVITAVNEMFRQCRAADCAAAGAPLSAMNPLNPSQHKEHQA